MPNTGNGQLGLGDRENRTTPTKITNLSNVTSLVAGGIHSLALTQDGTVYAWGHNSYGQLGDGSTEDRYTPV